LRYIQELDVIGGWDNMKTTEKWSDWKLDKWKLVDRLLWTGIRWLVFPLIPWAIMTSDTLNIPIDSNTYFAIFVTLFILNLLTVLNHPPRYRTLLKEGDSE